MITFKLYVAFLNEYDKYPAIRPELRKTKNMFILSVDIEAFGSTFNSTIAKNTSHLFEPAEKTESQKKTLLFKIFICLENFQKFSILLLCLLVVTVHQKITIAIKPQRHNY